MKICDFRPIILGGIAAAGLLPIASLAQKPPETGEAFISITADGELFNVPLSPVRDESGKTIWTATGFKLGSETAGYTITLDAQLNPDPSIAYGLAVADFGAPSAFIFAFFVPIVPTGSPNAVNASLVGGLTDFTGDNVSITPLLGPDVQIADVTAPLTNMGVDVGPAFVGTGAGAGALYGYGPFNEGPIAGPGPGPWTGLSATTAFTLSGGGDIAVLTGFAQIVEVPVPEPGTLMAGGALVALGAAGYVARRRSAAH